MVVNGVEMGDVMIIYRLGHGEVRVEVMCEIISNVL